MRYHFTKIVCKDVKACSKVPQAVMELALKGISDLEASNKKRACEVLGQSGHIRYELQYENRDCHGHQVNGSTQRTISSMIKKVESK
jgi:hypothetical protein